MYSKLGNFINGQWSNNTKEKIDVINPFNEEVLGQIPVSTKEDLDQALESAKKSFQLWKKTSPWERSKIIKKIADLIRERADDIAKTMTLETGKPLVEAKGETMGSAEQFDWYSEETKRIYGQIIEPRTQDVRMQVRYEPVGVVAAFAAWNFPILLPSRKVAAAIAAGCSVIIKPASETPGTCMHMIQACKDAGLPDGVVNFVTGKSSFISKYLIESPIIKKVSLTGSVDVGKEILHMAADGIKKVSMELGGHAPVLVLNDADVTTAAVTSSNTKFRNAGQVCISPTRFIVQDKVYSEYCEKFVENTKKLKLGNGLEEGTNVGPMANIRGLEHVDSLVQDAVGKGAKLLTGGKRSKDFNKGYFYEPTVINDVPSTADIMTVEPFGPVAPIVKFSELEEAFEIANSVNFGLAGYVFTSSLKNAHLASENLEVGMVGVNDMMLAAAEMPFGGVKESGFGREGGSLGILDYLVPKYTKFKIY
ncbi:NAD-dependent succinate-semialdehyde dehydrogenase [Pelagibacteraceae bacterium]|nr:NAD-dependent succinate-semialdehyde dehydrogenase [Pelagibacteraceae bacterium]